MSDKIRTLYYVVTCHKFGKCELDVEKFVMSSKPATLCVCVCVCVCERAVASLCCLYFKLLSALED